MLQLTGKSDHHSHSIKAYKIPKYRVLTGIMISKEIHQFGSVVLRPLLWFTINYVALSWTRGFSLRSTTPRTSARAVPRLERGDLIYI